MILDKQNLFWNDTAITVDAGSVIIDLGNDGSEVIALNQKGLFIKPFCIVTTAFAGGTSLAIAIQTDDDEAFGSPTTLFTTAAIVTASLVAGYSFKLPLGLPVINEQYIRLYADITTTMTGGALLAGLALDVQTNV